MFQFSSIYMHGYKTWQAGCCYIKPLPKGKYYCSFDSLSVPYNNQNICIYVQCNHHGINSTGREVKVSKMYTLIRLQIFDQEGLTQHICSNPSNCAECIIAGCILKLILNVYLYMVLARKNLDTADTFVRFQSKNSYIRQRLGIASEKSDYFVGCYHLFCGTTSHFSQNMFCSSVYYECPGIMLSFS